MLYTMMRRVLLLSLAASAFAFAADDPITAAEKAWAKAVVSGDAAAVESVLSPDLIYAHSTGVIESRAEYVGKIKSKEYNYKGIDHQSITVKMHGNSAVAHSKVRMHGINKSGPFDNQLIMLHLWVKQNGKWLLAAHQTTRLTQ